MVVVVWAVVVVVAVVVVEVVVVVVVVVVVDVLVVVVGLVGWPPGACIKYATAAMTIMARITMAAITSRRTGFHQ